MIYDELGKEVGATPDGRFCGTPLGDSAGAVQGRDTNGPTALLNSVTSLDLIHAVQTPVVNIRLSGKTLTEEKSRRAACASLDLLSVTAACRSR